MGAPDIGWCPPAGWEPALRRRATISKRRNAPEKTCPRTATVAAIGALIAITTGCGGRREAPSKFTDGTGRSHGKEADAAADLAIALAKGEKPTATTTPVNNEQKDVPSVLLDPVPVTKDNISDYTGEPDFPRVEEICAGKLAAMCTEIGLQ